MAELEDKWVRPLLKGFASAFMIVEAIAIYEVYLKVMIPLIDEAVSQAQPFELPIIYMIFLLALTGFIELIAYFKVLKPLSNKPLHKQVVAKNWVNTLFLISLVFGGLMTAGGIVGIALLAILIATLETQRE